jgi:hypothetical protein
MSGSRNLKNILRFMLVDKEQVALENVQRGPSSPLLSLPAEMLNMVLSHLEDKELLNFLVVQPSRQPDVCFKPKLLDISPVLDSIRLCLLASQNSVEEIECFNMASVPADMKNAVHSACWKKNLSSNRLKKLTIHDLSLLKDVKMSSTLTTLCFEQNVFEPPFETKKRDVAGICFPVTVTNVSLNYQTRSDFESDEGELAAGIFQLLPALKTLMMDKCPGKDFWRNVPTSVLENIRHLRFKSFSNKSYFPLSLATNLKTFVSDHGNLERIQMMVRSTESLPNLTALSLPYGSWETRGTIEAVKSKLNSFSFCAPKLKYVSFETFICTCYSGTDVDFLANFDYVRVHGYAVGSEDDIAAILRCIARVKCFEFIMKLLSPADENSYIISLRQEVEKVGGRLEILGCEDYQFYLPYWVKYKVHVRIFSDPSFDFEKLSHEHPLLFEREFFKGVC